MPSQSEKVNLLDNAGYVYDFDRMMFINRRLKKAFSAEFVSDRRPDEIATRIGEQTDGQDWHFYTSNILAPGVERELKRVLQ